MSTITYRDGVMASDSRGYSGTSGPIGAKQKIYVLADGTKVGISSRAPGQSEAFAAWIEKGSPVDDKPGFELDLVALVVRPDGQVFYYFDSWYPAGPVFAEYYSVGSGRDYALAAMACGRTAEEAIGVAALFDPWTGGSVLSTRPGALKEPPLHA